MNVSQVLGCRVDTAEGPVSEEPHLRPCNTCFCFLGCCWLECYLAERLASISDPMHSLPAYQVPPEKVVSPTTTPDCIAMSRMDVCPSRDTGG